MAIEDLKGHQGHQGHQAHPAFVLGLVAAATLALILSMYLAWLCFNRRRVRRLTEPFADSEIRWTAVPAESSLKPLLDLALQREAARRGPEFRVGLRGRGLSITGAWRSAVSIDDVGKDVDRWHRWTVEACFFRVNESFGACEALDVRAKTAWRSSTPPTSWPIDVVRLPTRQQQIPRPTSELL